MKKMKRLLSLTLVICMLFCMMPVTAFAADVTSGTCGTNLTWNYDSTTQTLTISGTGDMYDYNTGTAPWREEIEYPNSDIKNIVVTEGVTSIGTEAFYLMSGVESVTLPSTLKAINSAKYHGTFDENRFESITLPVNLEAIGAEAFIHCRKLESIVIPSKVKTIEDGTFYACEALVDVTLNEGLETIKEEAFHAAQALTEIKIPSTVISIDSGAFTRTDSLIKISVDEANESYCDVNGVLYSKDMTELVHCPAQITTLIIPTSVTSISNYAFSNGSETKSIVYQGTEGQWKNISVGTSNSMLTSANMTYMETDGYTAGLTTTSTSPRVNDNVTVNVAVNHSSDDYFNAAEMTFTYDSEKLSFNKDDSTLGTATVNVENGTITLEDYGADKNFGTGVYVLAFDAIKDGDATVTMTSAAFTDKDGAVSSDLEDATISSASVSFTIDKEQHTVTLPETDGDTVTGSTVVTDGESYTLTITPNPGYNYTVTATVDGQSVTVIDNGDGTYTVANVNGDLVFSIVRTAKTFNVTFEGTAKDDFANAAKSATYKTDYQFTLPTKEGWTYTVDSITIGGTAYISYTSADNVYTIPGADITGDIVITVNKVQVTANVSVEGNGAGAAEGFATSAEIGKPYSLTIIPEDGYNYTVTATMGGEAVELTVSGNTYTVQNVTGALVFTVTKTVKVDGVSVSQYVAVDGSNMWLVTNNITVAEGKVPTYDGNAMFWSDKYGTYCYLVTAETLAAEDSKGKVDITTGSAKTVDYSGDVNCTDKVDASDAQLTYDIYNATYSDFTTVNMEKFLRADVNGSGAVTVEDATAIINTILNPTEA